MVDLISTVVIGFSVGVGVGQVNNKLPDLRPRRPRKVKATFSYNTKPVRRQKWHNPNYVKIEKSGFERAKKITKVHRRSWAGWFSSIFRRDKIRIREGQDVNNFDRELCDVL